MPEQTSNNEFSKGVHEYLTHYIDVADAKAGILIAMASGLLGFVFQTENMHCFSSFLLPAIILEFFAIGFALYAVFPRLYTGVKGFIFWEDILTKHSAKDYVSEVEKLSIQDIERDYAEQNYFLSKILRRKYSAIRWSMAAFTFGAILVALFILFIKF